MRRLVPEPSADVDDMWDASAYRPTEDLRVNFVSSADGVVAVGGRSVSLSGPVD